MTHRSALLGALAMFFFGCTGGSCTPPPAPPDASPTPIDAIRVHDALVDGGCMSPDDSGDGVASVAALAASDAEPGWLSCLYSGGTVASCKVPCGD